MQDLTQMERRLEAIERKLGHLVDYVDETRRQQREMLELRQDLGRIATDVFQAATNELDEVAPYFETADLVHLIKKLMRNTRNLNRMLDQLESLSNLVDDAMPLQKAAFANLLEQLDALDKRGYFAFLAELQALVDRIVTSFSPEDVRLLGNNVVGILETVRSMTQPDVMRAMNNALEVYRHVGSDVEGDVGYLTLLREARSPEVRRGIAFGMQFLKNVSAARGPAGDGTATPQGDTIAKER